MFRYQIIIRLFYYFFTGPLFRTPFKLLTLTRELLDLSSNKISDFRQWGDFNRVITLQVHIYAFLNYRESKMTQNYLCNYDTLPVHYLLSSERRLVPCLYMTYT